jgi:hypothetical protein
MLASQFPNTFGRAERDFFVLQCGRIERVDSSGKLSGAARGTDVQCAIIGSPKSRPHVSSIPPSVSHRINILMRAATSTVALRQRAWRRCTRGEFSQVSAVQSFPLAPPVAAKTLARCLRLTQHTARRHQHLSRPTLMRLIIAISVALAAVGILALSINLPGMASELTGQFTEWRHTADGWEKVSSLAERISERVSGSVAPASGPHPVIISLLTGLFSTLCLVAFTPAQLPPAKSPQQRNGGPFKMPLGFCDWIDNPRLN